MPFLKSLKAVFVKHEKLDYLLFFAIGLLAISWFKGGHYISGGCFTWHVDFREYFQTALYVWEKMISTSYSLTRMPPLFFPYIVYGRLFQFVFGNSLFYEKLLFYICFSASGATSYCFLRTLGLKRIPGVLGALFYMVNPFASTVVWYQSIGLLFPLYSFLPLVIALAARVIEGKTSHFLANLLILITPIGSSYANPSFFLITLMTIVLYSGFYIGGLVLTKRFEVAKSAAKNSLRFCILMIVLNSFWILPLAVDLPGQFRGASNVEIGLPDDLTTAKLNSIRPLDAFRLMGLWSFEAEYHGDEYYPWHPGFSSMALRLSLAVIAAIVFLGLIEIFKKRRLRTFSWFLLFAIGFFLVSAFYLPFSSSLEGVYRRFPFILRAFRGGYTKYGYLYVLAYVAIFSGGVSLLYRRIGTKIVILILPIAFIGFPFITGEVIYQGGKVLKSNLINVPSEYLQFQSWDQANIPSSRYLALPISKNYNYVFDWQDGYQGADYLRQFSAHPIVAFRRNDLEPVLAAKINAGNQEAAVRAASLLGISKAILRSDINWDLSGNFLTNDKEKSEEFFSSLFSENSFGLFRIASFNSRFFLPTFYSPEELILTNNQPEAIGNLVEFADYKPRLAVANLTDLGGSEFADSALGAFLIPQLVDPITEQDLNNQITAEVIESVNFPYVRWRPGSEIYPFVKFKEAIKKRLSQNNLKQLFSNYLFFSNKRVSEIGKWGTNLNSEDYDKLVSAYLSEINSALEVLEREPELNTRENYFMLDSSLEAHLKKIDTNTLDKTAKDKLTAEIRTFLEVSKKIQPVFNPARRDYSISIPSPGDYEILVKASNLSFEAESFQLESRNTLSRGQSASNGWVSFGAHSLDSGEQDFRLIFSETQSLLADDLWLPFKKETQATIAENEIIFSDQIGKIAKDNGIYQEIRGYLESSVYRLSFDYYSPEGLAGLALVETISSENKRRAVLGQVLSKTFSDEHKSVEIFFESSDAADGATLYLFTEEGQYGTTVYFKNLKLEPVVEPIMIVRSDRSSLLATQPPRLSFSMVNPTKYEVEVENAHQPFMLVFNESFDPGWRAYVLPSRDQIAIPEVASYFNGEISEKLSGRRFIDKRTFEAWSRQSVESTDHFKVNGFANAWLVDPQTADDPKSFRIVVEFIPQRLYLIGLSVSIFVLVASVIILILQGNKATR